MLDWILFLDNVLYWVQWLTTFSILGLLGIACLAFFVSKKISIDCALLAVALILVATVFGQFGIQLVTPEVFAFFENFLK